jgi:hypothetical protein
MSTTKTVVVYALHLPSQKQRTHSINRQAGSQGSLDRGRIGAATPNMRQISHFPVRLSALREAVCVC